MLIHQEPFPRTQRTEPVNLWQEQFKLPNLETQEGIVRRMPNSDHRDVLN